MTDQNRNQQGNPEDEPLETNPSGGERSGAGNPSRREQSGGQGSEQGGQDDASRGDQRRGGRSDSDERNASDIE